MSMMQPSGPGPYSKRTDIQGAKRLPDAAYGEQKQFQEEQASAPMAKSPSSLAQAVPLTALTNRPNEPVTAGVDAGPGPGSSILNMKSPVDTQLDDLSKIAKYMPLMVNFADSSESSGTMKAFVRYLRSQGG